jgi:hypothetical protein
VNRIAVLLAVAALVVADAHGSDAHRQIEGVWRFQDEVDRRSDGSIFTSSSAFGYEGILIFTANGYMSSTIMPKGRTWTVDASSPADLRETFARGSAHAGRYLVDPDAHTINIESSVSLDPSEEGKWGLNRYSIENDTLSISGDWSYNGEKLVFTVRLTRVK